jgi:hypothetical protein
MKLSRLGICTFGNVCALITSASPTFRSGAGYGRSANGLPGAGIESLRGVPNESCLSSPRAALAADIGERDFANTMLLNSLYGH